MNLKVSLGPVETKVAGATLVPLVVGSLFQAAGTYHWFTPPPVGVIGSIVTVLTALVGWVLPHTSRLAAAPAFQTQPTPAAAPDPTMPTAEPRTT